MNYLTTNTILEQTVGANVIDCLVEYDQYGALQPLPGRELDHQ